MTQKDKGFLSVVHNLRFLRMYLQAKLSFKQPSHSLHHSFCSLLGFATDDKIVGVTRHPVSSLGHELVQWMQVDVR
ncbi:hypothetical protein D3C75_1324700 [compost metagenome]